MTKFIIIGIIAVSVLGLAACANRTSAVGELKSQKVTSDIHSLDIRINAADFTIQQGKEFSVESNLKNITISENNGVLTIIEKSHNSVNYNGAMLKLCIPDGTVFETANIETGAAKLTADSISANSIKLKLGAGKADLGNINAYKDIDIKGGAGEINVNGGTLNNLSLDLGAGTLYMTTALIGNNDLKFGIGDSRLTLVGNQSDYKFDIKNSIGTININNNSVSVGSIGNGNNNIKINGGIGTINISFQE